MSFPVIAGSAVSSEASATTDHVYDFPANIAAGDLLILISSITGSAGLDTKAGWDSIFSGSTGNNDWVDILVRVADGAEGASDTFTGHSAGDGAVVLRITGADTGVAPEVATTTGQNTTPDPPAGTPSWGSADTLYIALFGGRTGDRNVSAYPYTDNNISNDSVAGGGTEGLVGLCSLESTNTSEDPGTFSVSGVITYVAGTLMVKPAAAGIGTCGFRFVN